MTNAWIEHVKKYAKDNNIAYGCAITKAKDTYVKKDKPASITVKQITEILTSLDKPILVKLFTAKKNTQFKNKYDYNNSDRETSIKRILSIYNTKKDRQDIYDRIMKAKK